MIKNKMTKSKKKSNKFFRFQRNLDQIKFILTDPSLNATPL